MGIATEDERSQKTIVGAEMKLSKLDSNFHVLFFSITFQRYGD